MKVSYPGNKGVKTLIPHLINLVPPHKRYFELFLGSAGISRFLQLPAQATGIEISTNVIKRFKSIYPSGLTVINDCAISWLKKNIADCREDDFIYADPPYLKSVRRSRADIYDYELPEEKHIELLQLLTSTKARVVISGYDGSLYNRLLKGWNKRTFNVSVHGKRAAEVVWFNYQVPSKLHQFNFIGKDKTDRQRIKRKIQRWCDRLKQLPAPEREAIYHYLSCQHEKEI